MITILGMYIAHVHKVVSTTLIRPCVSSLESSGRVLAVHMSGVTENVILWTPLLITFVQTNMVGPYY